MTVAPDEWWDTHWTWRELHYHLRRELAPSVETATRLCPCGRATCRHVRCAECWEDRIHRMNVRLATKEGV
jgi:hypothetical protein